MKMDVDLHFGLWVNQMIVSDWYRTWKTMVEKCQRQREENWMSPRKKTNV